MPTLWDSGYSQDELNDAQAKFDLVFPPDLVALLREKRPAGGHDWRNDAAIRRMLAWPLQCLLLDVENNHLWWREWGERPSSAEARREVLQAKLSQAPRLIPLFSHRFLPATPYEVGNPIFSIYGADTIIYGTDLEDYFQREFDPHAAGPVSETAKFIPFWSELVDRNR